MHNNQCIISHSCITMLLFVIVFMVFLPFSMIIPFHRVAKYVLPFGITGLNEKGEKKRKKKKKDQTRITHLQTKHANTDAHRYTHTYPIIHACLRQLLLLSCKNRSNDNKKAREEKFDLNYSVKVSSLE